MKLKISSILTSLFLLSYAQGQVITTINFDIDSNWMNGSGRINSYQSDHIYMENDWTFTGDTALRQTSSTIVDGYQAALGEYGWRMNETQDASWSGTFTGTSDIHAISFNVRRWDEEPAVNWTVEISLNSGTDWTYAGTIDNEFLDNSSSWSKFSYDFDSVASTSSSSNLDDIVVKVTRIGGENIMIDNFAFTVSAIPEPSTYAAILGGLALGAYSIRRRNRLKATA